MNVKARKNLVLGMKEDIFRIQKEFSEKMNVKLKQGNPKDLVTDADKEIEKYLIKKIGENFPGDKIIGEEFGESQKGGSGFEWYLDPIDGTLFFVSGIKQYGTSVGLVYNGKIVFGAIFYSEDGNVYWAEDGKGAYCEEERLLCPSKKEKLIEFVLFTGLNSDSKKAEKDFETFSEVYPLFRTIFGYGSCVSNLINVAKGKADAYWEPYAELSPHDFCAGALIVKEAGGFVSHENPNEFVKPEKGELFASNGIIHKEFVELIKKHRK